MKRTEVDISPPRSATPRKADPVKSMFRVFGWTLHSSFASSLNLLHRSTLISRSNYAEGWSSSTMSSVSCILRCATGRVLFFVSSSYPSIYHDRLYTSKRRWHDVFCCCWFLFPLRSRAQYWLSRTQSAGVMLGNHRSWKLVSTMCPKYRFFVVAPFPEISWECQNAYCYSITHSFDNS